MARIDPDKRVYVYFNLHKKCFSVKQSGKVVSHDDCVLLKDCRFLVGAAGRERVLKEKKKTVHAGISGYVVDWVPAGRSECEVIYNPYKFTSFVDKYDHEPVDRADYAILSCGPGWRDVEALWT